MAKIEQVKNKKNEIIHPITEESAVLTADGGTLSEKLSDLDDIRANAALGGTAYQKPSTGIPAEDIAEGVVPTNTLQYSPQDLTPEQKERARANIDAASQSVLESLQGGEYVVVATLPTASASTAGKTYLRGPNSNQEYERFVTSLSGSTYSWVSIGTTAIASPIIADDLNTNDATKALSAKQGMVLGDSVFQQNFKISPLSSAELKVQSVNASSLPLRNYYIDVSTGNYTSNSTYRHSIFQVKPGQVVRVTTNENFACGVSFFKTDAAPVSGGTPDYSDDYATIYRVSVPADSYQDFIVPGDAYWCYIYRGSSSTTPTYQGTPAAISITLSRFNPDGKFTNIESTDIASIDVVKEAVANSEDYITETIDLLQVPEQDLSFSASNEFQSTGKHALIEVYPGDILKVVGGGGRVAFVGAVNCPNSGKTVSDTVLTTCLTLESGKTYILRAPENAIGFIYNTYQGEVSVAPTAIERSTKNEERPTFKVIPCSRFVPNSGVLDYGGYSSNRNFLFKVKGSHYYTAKFTSNVSVAIEFITELPRIGLSYTGISTTQNVNTLDKENTITFYPEQDGYYFMRCFKSSGPTLSVTVYDVDKLRNNNGEFTEFWRLNINSLTKRNFLIDSTNGLYGNSTSYHHVLLPIRPGQKVKIIKGANNARFAWFTSDSAPTNYGVPPYVPGTGSISTQGGIYTAPEGANYIWIYTGDSSNSYWPSYVGISMDYATMPDIVLDNNYTETRRLLFQLKSTTRAENDIPYKPLILLHYSDIHGRVTCQNRINEYREFWKDYIDDTIQTGDVVTSYWGDGTAFGDESDPENNPSKDILSVIGNHDVASKSGSDFIWHTYQGKQAYDRYIGPYVSNWDVAQPEGAEENGYCFYYKDYPDSKIRLIVLDTFNNNSDYKTAQQSWFSGVLEASISDGLSVIIASHFRIKCETLLKSPFTMPSAAVENPDSSVCNDPYIPLVNDFINNGGELVCWITGHSHYDAISKTSDEQGAQINICVNRAGAFGSKSTSLWETNSRINIDFSDWKTFDCFNVMAIDTVYKTISLLRVGSNWDKMGRRVETCCIKYNTGEILYP